MPLKTALLALTACLACVIPAPAPAQERPNGPPSATVSIKQFSVAFIGSAAAGSGTLHFRGRSYPLRVGGLGVGGIGAAMVKASGEVYGLTNRRAFAGAYAQLQAGWAAGDLGRGTLWLTNDHGVTMRLRTHSRGLQFSLGADGVLIGFK